MIDFFEQLDTSITLWINGLHFPFLDKFMWAISAKVTWVPYYLFILHLVFKRYSPKVLLLFFALILVSVGLSDFISSQIIKETVQRYRPSHNLNLQHLLHLYQFQDGSFYRGGQFGFVSSHSANFFAIATFAYLTLKQSIKNCGYWFFGIAILVALSRVYLGVHYLSDVVVGGGIGILIAFFVHRFGFVRGVKLIEN